MEAPKGWQLADGRWSWSHSAAYRIEYELWLAAGPVKLTQFASFFRAKYSTNYSVTNLTNRFAELIDAGKVQRLGRGLYVHVAHLDKVKQADLSVKAPTLAYMLS